jgi:hypothetical protein
MVTTLFIIGRLINPKHEIRNSKQFQMNEFQIFETNKSLGNFNFEHSNLFRISIFGFRILGGI